MKEQAVHTLQKESEVQEPKTSSDSGGPRQDGGGEKESIHTPWVEPLTVQRQLFASVDLCGRVLNKAVQFRYLIFGATLRRQFWRELNLPSYPV